MVDLIREIEQADVDQMGEVLKAVMRRFDQLFPDRELSVFILRKSDDRNEQIDLNIAYLKNMKRHS